MENSIGDDTRVIGIHAHNPLGITFATDVYAGFYGRQCEPINADEFRRLDPTPGDPASRRPGIKVIVGGPGAWQIEHKNLQAEWNIDCSSTAKRKTLSPDCSMPRSAEKRSRRVECNSPKPEKHSVGLNRSTFGVVEITRGCGRGCQFCSVALRSGKSIPLDHILENVRSQVAQGADTITLTTEDLFLYEQGKKFATNVPALRRLFSRLPPTPGVRHIMMTHGTMAPVVVEPEIVRPHLAGDLSVNLHPDSTHPDNRYAMMFVGLETGSVRLFRQFMKGKSYPYRPEQWPDVVLKGMKMMNRANWFPMCTFIIGLPGETDADVRESLDLLFALKDAKWCVIPTLFVPLEDTRLGSKESANRPHDRSAVGVLLHLLALQYRLLPAERETPVEVQPRHPALLLRDGPQTLRSVDEVPASSPGSCPRTVPEEQAVPRFLRQQTATLQLCPDAVDVPEERRRPEFPTDGLITLNSPAPTSHDH